MSINTDHIQPLENLTLSKGQRIIKVGEYYFPVGEVNVTIEEDKVKEIHSLLDAIIGEENKGE